MLEQDVHDSQRDLHFDSTVWPGGPETCEVVVFFIIFGVRRS